MSKGFGVKSVKSHLDDLSHLYLRAKEKQIKETMLSWKQFYPDTDIASSDDWYFISADDTWSGSGTLEECLSNAGYLTKKRFDDWVKRHTDKGMMPFAPDLVLFAKNVREDDSIFLRLKSKLLKRGIISLQNGFTIEFNPKASKNHRDYLYS